MMQTTTHYKAKGLGMKLVMQIFCIAVASSCVFPLLWMISSSLKTQETVFSNYGLIPVNPRWQNYVTAWTKGGFGIYFLNSFFYTTTVVTGIVFIASMAAYAFARLEFPWKKFLFTLFLTTMMIPIPGSFIALYVLVNKLGLVNTRLGYILPQINAQLPLSIFLLKTFFEKLPKELEDSARIDGATKWGIYWHLALPLARPAIAVVVIFNVLAVWNEYFWAMLVLADKSLMPLQRGLMVFQGAHFTQYPLLMAGMTLSVVPVIVVYLLMQRHIIEGITAGAIKG